MKLVAEGGARASLAHTKNPTYRAAFLWQMRLGLRLGEALGIWHRDIESDVVHIRRQVQRNRLTEKLEPSPLSTDRDARTLPLSGDLMEALAAVPRNGDFAFPSEAGGAIDP